MVTPRAAVGEGWLRARHQSPSSRTLLTTLARPWASNEGPVPKDRPLVRCAAPGVGTCHPVAPPPSAKTRARWRCPEVEKRALLTRRIEQHLNICQLGCCSPFHLKGSITPS